MDDEKPDEGRRKDKIERLVDELDSLWDAVVKNEVTAVNAMSTAEKTRAKLRAVEVRLLHVQQELQDLRKQRNQ